MVVGTTLSIFDAEGEGVGGSLMVVELLQLGEVERGKGQVVVELDSLGLMGLAVLEAEVLLGVTEQELYLETSGVGFEDLVGVKGSGLC